MSSEAERKVLLRATYRQVGPDGEEAGGFTDPRNPWGGADDAVPEMLCGERFVAWRDANTTWIELGIEEAARFVAEFPGGVWDATEAEFSTVDYARGTRRAVLLHVEGADGDVEQVMRAAFPAMGAA